MSLTCSGQLTNECNVILIKFHFPFQLYELDNDPKRKEFLDDLFTFMQKRGKNTLQRSTSLKVTDTCLCPLVSGKAVFWSGFTKNPNRNFKTTRLGFHGPPGMSSVLLEKHHCMNCMKKPPRM